MSTTRRIAFGATAQWISRAITIVLGLVLMPVLLRHMSKEEVGVWLLLGQSWAVLGVLDLGFGATLTRRIALAKGKSGGNPDTPLNAESLAEIADLAASGRRIYRWMAAGVFLVSWSLGFVYLRHLSLDTIDASTAWLAWTILCASQALTVWGSVWTCLMQGVGYVGWDALIATLISAVTLTIQIIAVICGGGLVALAVVATLGATGQRFLSRGFSFRRNPELFAQTGKWNPAVMRGMAGLSVRAWLTSLGTVLVFNTDGFFIAYAAGAENIPAYRAAFLVLLNVHVMASVLAQSSSVFISQLWQAGEHDEVRRIFQRNLRVGLSIMLCGGAAVLFAGESLFNVWLGASNYVGLGIVAVFVVLFVFEQQSFIISTSCRATEQEPFAGWMMAGGLLKLAAAIPMMKFFGLLGLAVATLGAQMVTAHWFVTQQGLRRLQFGFLRYLSKVLLPCAGVFLIACGMSWGLAALTSANTDLIKVAAVFSGAGLAFVTAFWCLAFDAGHRARIMGRLRGHRAASVSS